MTRGPKILALESRAGRRQNRAATALGTAPHKKRQKTAWIVARYGVFLPTSKSGAGKGYTNLSRHFGFPNGRHPLPSAIEIPGEVRSRQLREETSREISSLVVRLDCGFTP
jgi:hypothetical protein